MVRVTPVNAATVRSRGDSVLSWMIAARRTTWSFALDHAVARANQLGRPLIVLEALRARAPVRDLRRSSRGRARARGRRPDRRVRRSRRRLRGARGAGERRAEAGVLRARSRRRLVVGAGPRARRSLRGGVRPDRRSRNGSRRGQRRRRGLRVRPIGVRLAQRRRDPQARTGVPDCEPATRGDRGRRRARDLRARPRRMAVRRAPAPPTGHRVGRPRPGRRRSLGRHQRVARAARPDGLARLRRRRPPAGRDPRIASASAGRLAEVRARVHPPQSAPDRAVRVPST